MNIEIKDIDNNDSIIKNTIGTQWIDCDFETETCVFFPDEIAIEVSGYYTGENETWNVKDIENDIKGYFDDYIYSILERTIEIIQAYGGDVSE